MANNVLITPASSIVKISATGTTSSDASRIQFYANDESTLKAAIYELNGNLYLNTVSGDIVLGDGTPGNIELGDAGIPVDLDFLGGGTISSNGNSLDIGSSGDTVNLNVSGVTYNFPATVALASDTVNIAGSQTITGSKTFSASPTISASTSLQFSDGSTASAGSIRYNQNTRSIEFVFTV